LQGINKAVFSQYRANPEDFMQKAEHLIYDYVFTGYGKLMELVA